MVELLEDTQRAFETRWGSECFLIWSQKRGATSSFLIAIVHLEVTLQKGTDVLPKEEEG
jgi:hypothetical protein